MCGRALIRQRIRTNLNVIHRADVSFREFGQVRTIRRPDAAALPTGLWIIDAAVEPARVERHRIRHAEDGERFFLGVKDKHGVGSRPGDDYRILAHSERVELIYPKEVGIFGAAGFHASARKLRSRQIPVFEGPGFGIEFSKVSAAGGESHASVASLNLVSVPKVVCK